MRGLWNQHHRVLEGGAKRLGQKKRGLWTVGQAPLNSWVDNTNQKTQEKITSCLGVGAHQVVPVRFGARTQGRRVKGRCIVDLSGEGGVGWG